MKNSWMGWLIMALILLSGCTNTPKQEAMHATTPHTNQRLPRNLPKKMFGIALQLPADFNSYTQGEHFLWLSNNDTEVVENIALYSIKENAISALNVPRFCHLRDSVMHKNVRGISDAIYMTTLQASVRGWKDNTTSTFWFEGLWEMQNDAMGGRFICHAIKRPSRHDILFAEAILYAPKTENKTILMR